MHIKVYDPKGEGRVVVASTYEELEEQCRKKFSIPPETQIQLRNSENIILDEDAFSILTEETTIQMSFAGEEPENVGNTNLISATSDMSGPLNCQVGDKNVMIIHFHDHYKEFVEKKIESLPSNETLISLEHPSISPESKGFILDLEVIINDFFRKSGIEGNILRALQADNCKKIRELVFYLQEFHGGLLTKIKTGSFILELFFFDESKKLEMIKRKSEFEKYLNATFELSFPMCPVLSILTTGVEGGNATREDVMQFSPWKIHKRIQRLDEKRLPENEQWSGCVQRIKSALNKVGMPNIDNTIRLANQCINSLSDSRDEDLLNTLLVIEKSGSMRNENFTAGIASCKQFFNEIDLNSKHQLDEKVGIVAFGNEIQTLSRFSFDFNSQLTLLENILKETTGRTSLIEGLLCSFLAVNYFDGEMNPSISKTNRRIVFISEGNLSGAEDKKILKTLTDTLERENLLVPLHFHYLLKYEEEIGDLVHRSNGLLIPKHGGRILGKFNRLTRRPDLKLDALDVEDSQFVNRATHIVIDKEQHKKTM